IVLYGYISVHEFRNIDNWVWAKALAERNSDNLAVPYATIDANGALVRNPPERYPKLMFDTHSALLTLLEDRYAQFREYKRDEMAPAVLTESVRAMKNAAERLGAKFIAVDLYEDSKDPAPHIEYLRSSGAEVLDCRFSVPDATGYVLPEDDHPNEIVHTF